MNAVNRSKKEILNSVPLGSLSGPLLFNVFTNDIFFFVINNHNTLSILIQKSSSRSCYILVVNSK